MQIQMTTKYQSKFPKIAGENVLASPAFDSPTTIIHGSVYLLCLVFPLQ